MSLNRAYADCILQHVADSVERRNGRFRVTLRQLSEHLLQKLTGIGMKSFGYSDAAAARNDIYEAYSAIGNIDCRRVNAGHVDLRRQSVGSIVYVSYDGGRELSLMLCSDGVCMVLSDDEHTLLPGDILYPMQLVLQVSQPVVFQVVRDGRNYPSEELYFALDCINQLDLIVNDGINIVERSRGDVTQASAVTGLRRIYASRSSGEGRWFNPADFGTGSQSALFWIEFLADGGIQYGYNEGYVLNLDGLDLEEARSRTIACKSLLGEACVMDSQQPLPKLRTVEPGILSPRTDARGRILLYIDHRAVLGVPEE